MGKRRSFLRGLALTVLTVGVYAIYWWYKAPHEVYRQFELEDEGREESAEWLVVGIPVPVFLLLYFWRAIGNVRYVRARLGLPEGLRPLTFLLLFAGPSAALVVLYLALFLLVVPYAPGFESLEDLPPHLLPVVEALADVAVVVAVVGLAATVLAFYLLQRDINGVWDAWSRRMRELTAPPRQDPAPAAEAPSFEAPGVDEVTVWGA